MDSHADVWSMVSAAVAVVALLLSVGTMITARGRKEFDETVTAVRAHGDRLTAVEGVLKHMPDAAQLHGLKVEMAEIKGNVAVIVERVEPIKAIAERLQDVLLERSK